MHGFGVLRYPSDNIAYTGTWHHNQFEGTGKLYNENADKIVGEFNYKDFNKVDNYWQMFEG